MLQSNEIDQLAASLVKVQTSLNGALKDSSNPFFKSKYADLESVWAACREPLTSNGLCVVQGTAVDPTQGTCVVTTLYHTSGQWVRGMLPINAKANDPQGQGSAITYARRYALAALVGVVQTDDDGEAAMARPQKPASPSNVIRSESIAYHRQKSDAPTISTTTPKVAETLIPAIDELPALIKAIGQYGKVAIDKKKMSLDEVVALVNANGAPNKEALTLDGAKAVYKALKEAVNG